MPQSARLCDVCGKSFARTEHLRRHERIHNRKDCYRCHSCPKAFDRRDVLRRHERTHVEPPLAPEARSSRACINCSIAKARCNKGTPCQRCLQRNLQCMSGVPGEATASPQAHLSLPRENYAGSDEQSVSAQNPGDAPTAPTSGAASEPAIPEVFEYLAHDLFLSSRDHGTDVMQSCSVNFPVHQTYASQHVNSFDTNGRCELDEWTTETATGPNRVLMDINWLPNSDVPSYLHEGYDPWSNMGLTAGSISPFLSGESLDGISNFPMTSANNFHGTTNAHAQDISLMLCHDNAQMSLNHDPSHDAVLERSHCTSKGAASRTTGFRALAKSKRPQHTRFCLGRHGSAGTGLNSKEGRVLYMQESAYKNIAIQYAKLCETSNSIFPPFEKADLPSRSDFEHMCEHYVSNFDHMVPCVHLPGLTKPDTHWLLTLAIAAVGSQYISAAQPGLFAASMQEFLRRCLIEQEEQWSGIPVSSDQLAQIRFLHAIGAGYLGHGGLYKSALRTMSDLVSFCISKWTPKALAVTEDFSGNEDEWRRWVKNEQRVRLGYGIWLLDCMWSFQHHRPSAFSLADASPMPIPSDDGLWNAETAGMWSARFHRNPARPSTFSESLQRLYVDKHVVSNIGTFRSLLLIHGVFHQTWGVAAHVQQGLARFEPSSERQGETVSYMEPTIWPPSVPLYNKWRNAACDCLDILQSTIEKTTIKTNGKEPPIILQLHQARLILLSPIRNVVRLASYMSWHDKGTPLAASYQEAAEDRRVIHMWITRDRFKARLAVIHAGLVFWHARRYSARAFYEPMAISLAALTMWAFTAFTVKHMDTSKLQENGNGQNDELRSDQPHPGDQSEAAAPDRHQAELSHDSDCTDNVVVLDRPIDHELMRLFVHHGEKMHTHIAGVGNIFNAESPPKILVRAMKLLNTLGTWHGSTSGWLELLGNLETATMKLMVDDVHFSSEESS